MENIDGYEMPDDAPPLHDETPTALISTKGSNTVVIKIPFALVDEISAATSESDMREALKTAGASCASDTTLLIDGTSLVGSIAIRAGSDGRTAVRPSKAALEALVDKVTEFFTIRRYEVNPRGAHEVIVGDLLPEEMDPRGWIAGASSDPV